MSWTDFLKSFLRQSTYALAFSAVVALFAEYLTPGSVTPFLDPLPVAILALTLLSADAMRRQVRPNIWMRVIARLIMLVLVGLLFVSVSGMTGRTDTLAFGVVAFALVLILTFMIRPGEKR